MRYQYQSDFFSEQKRGSAAFPDAIRLLISVNFAIFILQTISGQREAFFRLFGLIPAGFLRQGMLWQPFTYLFLHGGIWHVLTNMFILWMFGAELERAWGRRAFLRYYFLTGVAAGIVTAFAHFGSFVPVVGASGAIYGVLLAYGLTFSNRTIYLYFLVPIRAKYFAALMGGIAFLSSLNPAYSGISHLTHFSGMAVGYLYLKSSYRGISIRDLARVWVKGWELRRAERRKRQMADIRGRVDALLDKISAAGYDKLTEGEKQFLQEASRKLAEKEKAN